MKAKAVWGRRDVTLVATSKDGEVSSEISLTIVPKDSRLLILRDEKGRNVTKETLLVDLNQTGTTVALKPELLDGTGVGQVQWSPNKSSRTAEIRIEDNVLYVTPLAAGTVKVTAKTTDGRTATVSIKAAALTGAVTISQPETGLEVASGKTLTLKALCEGVAKGTVNWSIVSGDAYAKISTGGKLTAAKDVATAKTVTVRATAKDGSGVYAEAQVKILPIAQGVQIRNAAGAALGQTLTWDLTTQGNTLDLFARVFPYYGEDSENNAMQAVTWKSSSAKVAQVEDGHLVIHKTGTVTITATAADGSGKKVTLKLTVIKTV